MRPRAVLALSVFSALALGAYACDDGTFASPLPVYQSDGGQPFVSEDSSAPADGSFADVLLLDGGDAASAQDGDAANPGDSGEAGSAVDGGDAGGDASGKLDAADGGG